MLHRDPLTALVGINGSGKSNVGDALRFLSECLREGLDTAVSRRNGINSLIRWSSIAPLPMDLDVQVSNAHGKGRWSFGLIQKPDGTFEVYGEHGEWQPSGSGSSLDLNTVRAANIPSFGTFERALRFLASANPGEVYPPPAAPL